MSDIKGWPLYIFKKSCKPSNEPSPDITNTCQENFPLNYLDFEEAALWVFVMVNKELYQVFKDLGLFFLCAVGSYTVAYKKRAVPVKFDRLRSIIFKHLILLADRLVVHTKLRIKKEMESYNPNAFYIHDALQGISRCAGTSKSERIPME